MTEPNDDYAWDLLYGIVGEQQHTAVMDIVRKRERRWEYLPGPRVKKIWRDFAKTSLVRDEKGLEKIARIFVENVAKVYVYTELSGHTQRDPISMFDEECEDHGLSSSELDGLIYDYIADKNGSMMISDYAMDPLLRDAARVLGAKTPVQKLVAIDWGLNRVHQRSDISAWFLVGGQRELNELAEVEHEQE